jgi:RNA polymerase sigma factor (sigma-70 family)
MQHESGGRIVNMALIRTHAWIAHGSEQPPEHVRPLDDLSAERECLALAQRGDSEAFGKLVERYAARIYTHLYRLVRSREEAEDLAQETFLRAFRFLHRYDNARPFKNWIYAIATNVGMTALQARKRDVVILDEEALTSNTAARNIERDEGKQRLGNAIAHLSAQSAALIHLHYHEGVTLREAAEILGINESAAKVALHRARKALRERMTKEKP